MEDVDRFKVFCEREGLNESQRSKSVTPEIFDLLSKGKPTPFINYYNCWLYNTETREAVEKDRFKRI
jgi:hypothetical protein